MEFMTPFIFILGALLAGIVSPGPSFVLITRTAIGDSRRNGIAAAMGMGIGSVLFTIIALLGLHAVLSTIPLTYLALKVLGGLYLLFLALQIWRSAKREPQFDKNNVQSQNSVRKALAMGFMTQISNPKTAVVYGSVFAALLPREIPTGLYVMLPPSVFVIEAGWYAIVACMISTATPRALYLRAKSKIDKAVASLMSILGLKLLLGSSSL